MALKNLKLPNVPAPAPKIGDCWTCAECGMKISVTANCTCPNGSNVIFQCCCKDMKQDPC